METVYCIFDVDKNGQAFLRDVYGCKQQAQDTLDVVYNEWRANEYLAFIKETRYIPKDYDHRVSKRI